MSNRIVEAKRAARAQMKAVISRTARTERDEWSNGITEKVIGLAEWENCQTVLAFLPMAGEVDTTGIITRSLKAGKAVGVPRMYGPDIKFHKIDTVDGPWDHHPYGLPEPPVSLPVIDPCSANAGDTFVVTPGLCFDNQGNRLGFGRGYYDRVIRRCRSAENRRIFFAAVCFNLQLVECVPTGEHDCVLDLIVTESGVAWKQEVRHG